MPKKERDSLFVEMFRKAKPFDESREKRMRRKKNRSNEERFFSS